MKVGDLVTPVIPPGHGSPRIRLYDIPIHVADETQPGSFRFPKVVTKMEEGECGLVTEVGTIEHLFIQTPPFIHARVLIRGTLGWTKIALLKVVEP